MGAVAHKGMRPESSGKEGHGDRQDTHSLGAGILDVFSRMRSIRRGFLRSSDLFWPLVLFLFSSESERKKRHHGLKPPYIPRLRPHLSTPPLEPSHLHPSGDLEAPG